MTCLSQDFTPLAFWRAERWPRSCLRHSKVGGSPVTHWSGAHGAARHQQPQQEQPKLNQIERASVVLNVLLAPGTPL